MRDTLTVGSAAGVAGTIIMHLFSMLWHAVGLARLSSLEISGLIFLTEAELHTPFGWTLAIIVHLIIGAAGGVALAYLLRSTGKDHWWLKGLGLAGFMLLGGMGFVLPVIGITTMRSDAGTTLSHAIDFAIYGLAAAYIIVRYMHDTLHNARE